MYVHIQPTADSLSFETVEAHFQRLHGLDPIPDWWKRIRASPPTPIEWLLVADGDDDRHVEYYAGCRDPDVGTRLLKCLRGLFPDTYELDRVAIDPLDPITSIDPDRTALAALEFYGRTADRQDWQTKLTPASEFLATDSEHTRIPLATIVETMATEDVPMVYQAIVRPLPDWSSALDVRRVNIQSGRDTLGDQLFAVLFDSAPPDEENLSLANEHRLAELDAKNARQSFVVNARLVAIDREGNKRVRAPVEELAPAFSEVGHTTYELGARIQTGDTAKAVLRAIEDGTVHPPTFERLWTRLPVTANTSRGIVADPSETPNFCLVSGAALTSSGQRVLQPTPDERTTIQQPPTDLLETYHSPGLTLGRPLTQDGTADEQSLALPPSLQPLHVAWFGKTGSGKSTALVRALLDNHAATDGADVLIDPKGDGMAIEYLRAHYVRFGSLENVYHFDCRDLLPAFSFFDIRGQLAAGIDRTTAVENTVDHYVELLKAVMGPERYERAVRSPDIIRYLLKAQFDPVHGADSFSHRAFQGAVQRLHETRDPPPVTDPDLRQLLGNVSTNSKRSFDEVMQGVANRVEKVPVDRRLARMFNHSPAGVARTHTASDLEDEDTEAGDDAEPHFDFLELLDEDAVIIFDTGGLRAHAQRVFTLVALSELWTALKRRTMRQQTHETDGDADSALPLVNVYIEEAASVAVSDLLGQLLAQSRSFGCSLTLAMQYPGQLRTRDKSAYTELLNNVSTIVTGNVPLDDDLARRLATAEMTPADVAARLRALRRGQWLVSLPAPFAEDEPRPFLVESANPPKGHPASGEELDETHAELFEAALTRSNATTEATCGLAFGDDGVVAGDRSDVPLSTTHDSRAGGPPITSTLPFTERLPGCVDYDERAHALVCTSCGNRYAARADGLRRTIACCHSLADVDRDDVPICSVDLTLRADERQASDYSDRQLVFLKVVYMAHQQHFDRELEYDIVWDSMVRLQEYVGIDQEQVDELVENGLLTRDCTHPHRLYTVTAVGRDEIQVGHREGIAYGHKRGDLSESSLHVLMVETGRRYLGEAFVDDPDSPVVEAVSYYEVEGHRYDAVGLDVDGEIVVTLEAERSNHDTLRAVPEDFDKMAAQEPMEAIWIVKNRAAAHEILRVLNEPPEGEPRVAKTYSENTPPTRFTIDTAGLTDVFTVQYLRDSLLEAGPPGE